MADYVSKYTGDEVDSILDEAIELPQSSSSDEGKVLKVNSTGEPVWQTINTIPNYIDDSSPNTDVGKFLTVTECGLDWAYPAESASLPDADSSDEGKFLKYSNSSGAIWDNISNLIPDGTGHGGQVLTASSTGDGYDWADPIDTTSASDGQFLRYASNTGIVWEDPFHISNASEGNILKYGSNGLEWTALNNLLPAGNNGEYLQWTGNGLAWTDSVIDTSNAFDGEFLKYSSNTGVMWDNVPSIDTSDASDGQFLKYSSNTGMMWETLSVFPSGAIDGSILTYNNEHNEYVWAAQSGAEGQVLTYVPASGSGYTVAWADVDRLPTYDSSDNGSDVGKVLTVNSSGQLGWYSLTEIQSNSI